MIGGHWDVSWHRSIGRDSFWTPPHMAIYGCGVLAAITAGYTILGTTWRGSDEARAAAVHVLGFRGPLGSFIMAWGGIAMLVSAPFDNWWHSAYGLDVEILSPPHTVLMLGIAAIQLGTLILILGEMNRSTGARRIWHERLFLYVGGVMVALLLFGAFELIDVVVMHTVGFYRVVALVGPIVLAATARATGHRWGATITALVYMASLLAFDWVLPRFPAEPKLGPVFHQVTCFVPPGFPLLLVVPAAAMDLVLRRPSGRRWLLAAVLGVVFCATFALVQWPFASFLMTPAARNWFFAVHYFDFYTGPNSYLANYRFYLPDQTTEELAVGIGTTVLAAVGSAWIGLAWGDGMRRIRR
jgi:hypothetical protein